MDAEEKSQNIFLHFIKALRVLAMDPEPQCELREISTSRKNFNTRLIRGDTS